MFVSYIMDKYYRQSKLPCNISREISIIHFCKIVQQFILWYSVANRCTDKCDFHMWII